LDLVAAGIVVFALLLASYSTRNTWIALGSGAVSIAVLAGAFFLYTAEDTRQVRQGLGQLAKQLPAGWDQRAQVLATVIEQASTALANAKKRASVREPILAMSISDWFGWGGGKESSSEADSPEDAPAARETHQAAIKWLLDEPPPAGTAAFLVNGVNVSDAPLKVVRAVLKPDSGADQVQLILEAESGDEAVIPPGAHFRLKAEDLSASQAKQFGGAILSFAYEQAGRRKSSILYLTQDVLAQDEARD